MKTHAQKFERCAKRVSRRASFALLALVAIVAAMAGLSSCAGYATKAAGSTAGQTGAGTLSASSGSLSFGSVSVGGSSTLSLSVTNTGSGTVNISQSTISGAAFSVVGGNPSSTIPASQSVTVQVQFAPPSAGNATGTFTIASDATNSPLMISLSGTGTQPALTISPSALNFNNVTVGQTSSQNVTLTNSGNADLTITGAAVSGSGFAISGLSLPKTLTAGKAAMLSVQFTPASATSVSGSVVFTDNAPGSPLSIGLSGSGLQALDSVSPTSVSFGSVVVGNSNSSVITLTNTGNSTLIFSQVSVTGSGFSVSGISTSTTITAGGTLNFNAVFTPTSATSSSGFITLTTNGSPAQLTISLTGTGTTATQTISASPASLSFGNVQVGGSSSLTTTITNTGNANVTISSVSVTGAGYTASGITSGLILSPNQTATLTIKFAPAGLGSASGSVSVVSNATDSPTTISLSGESHTVLLSWRASTSTGVTGYYVYRKTPSGSYTKLNASSPAPTTQYTDTTIHAATTYSYVVTAVYPSGTESSYSNAINVSVP